MATESDLVKLLNGDDWNEDRIPAVIGMMEYGGCDLNRVRPHLAKYGLIRRRQVVERMQHDTAHELWGNPQQ